MEPKVTQGDIAREIADEMTKVDRDLIIHGCGVFRDTEFGPMHIPLNEIPDDVRRFLRWVHKC